eukprot:6492703-Amphidinium_carterae.2
MIEPSTFDERVSSRLSTDDKSIRSRMKEQYNERGTTIGCYHLQLQRDDPCLQFQRSTNSYDQRGHSNYRDMHKT